MEEDMKIVEQFLKECEEEILKALESGELQTFMAQKEVPSLEAKSLANRFRKK